MKTVVYGPPRSGKTFHAKALATYFGCSEIIECDGPDYKGPVPYELRADQNALYLTESPPPHGAVAPSGAIWITIKAAKIAAGIINTPPG